MGLHNKHAWKSWQSEERQHSSCHAPQVPSRAEDHTGEKRLECKLAQPLWRPDWSLSGKAEHTQTLGQTRPLPRVHLQKRDCREAKQGPLRSSKGPQSPAPEISHEVGQAPRDAPGRGSQHDGCGGGSLHPNPPLAEGKEQHR